MEVVSPRGNEEGRPGQVSGSCRAVRRKCGFLCERTPCTFHGGVRAETRRQGCGTRGLLCWALKFGLLPESSVRLKGSDGIRKPLRK